MSIHCKDCGAVAGRGQELGHKTGCPAMREFRRDRRQVDEALRLTPFISGLNSFESAVDDAANTEKGRDDLRLVRAFLLREKSNMVDEPSKKIRAAAVGYIEVALMRGTE